MRTLDEIRAVSVKPIDYELPMISKAYERVSWYFTYALIFLGFTANQVSITGTILGGIVAITYATGNYIPASLLFLLIPMCDACDGKVARYRKEYGLPDERLRRYGGFFDWSMNLAPPIIFLLMSISFMEEKGSYMLIIGFFSASLVFYNSGFPALSRSLSKSKKIRTKTRITSFIRTNIYGFFPLPIILLAISIINNKIYTNALFHFFFIYIAIGIMILILETMGKK